MKSVCRLLRGNINGMRLADEFRTQKVVGKDFLRIFVDMNRY